MKLQNSKYTEDKIKKVISNLKIKPNLTFLHTDKAGRIEIMDNTDYVHMTEEAMQNIDIKKTK